MSLKLGNMSNPCINRWGLNTFWYRFWFSDNFYAQNLHQDTAFTNLIQLYLKFGIHVPKPFFWNNYWYNRTLSRRDPMQYFRWLSLRNHTLGSVTTYRMRISSDEVFPMRLWVFKFGNWIVVNLYWFKTWKGSRAKFMKKRLRAYDVPVAEVSNSSTHVRRIRSILKILCTRHALSRTTYCF